MSDRGPPPPPKRKNHKPVAVYGSGSGIPVPVGSAHNVARALVNDGNYSIKAPTRPEPAPVPQQQVRHEAPQRVTATNNRICIIDGHADAVIGAGVEIHGDFQFDKLLRIDGKFQGNLFSNNRGDIIVGKTGCIIGDVIIARKMVVEGGHVVGKIVVEELLLQDHTVIKGDITAKLLQIEGPHVTISGRANVHALAPEIVDENDNIITEFPQKVKKPKRDVYAPRSPGKVPQTSPIRSDMRDQETDTPESTSLSPVRQGKSSSAQTNASAKPSRPPPQPVRTPEEQAALDAALAERNAAKERHRQAKLAKKGGGEATSLPTDEEVPPVAASNGKQGTSKGAERAAVAATADVIHASLGTGKKSPAKLLPPSEAQRKAQLQADKNAPGGDDFLPELPDVERERAAVNLQRVARGRLARRATQGNELTLHEGEGSADPTGTAATAADVKRTRSDGDIDLTVQGQAVVGLHVNGLVSAPDLQKQHEAAVGLQKVARGRLARQEVTKQHEAATHVQRIARGKLARAAVKGDSQKASGGAAAVGEGASVVEESADVPPALIEEPAAGVEEGTATGEAGTATAEPSTQEAGPGYAEALVNNS